MKKLYALLLLGSLLLLGTGNVWATTYSVHHNGILHGTEGTWESSDMTTINGVHHIVFTNVPASKEIQFGIKIDGSGWEKTYASDGSNVSLSEQSNNVTFTLAATSDVKISYVSSTNKIYVNTVCEVTVYSSIDVPYLYVWYHNDANSGSDWVHNGGWPGAGKSADDPVSLHGQNWYKYSFYFPKDKYLQMIWDNGQTGDDLKQTGNIGTHNITSNTTFFMNVTENTNDYSAAHSYNYLLGDFNTWGGSDVLVDGLLTKNLTGSESTYHNFKVWDGADWYSWGTGDNYKTFEGNDYKDLYTNNNNLILHAKATGDYVFGWAPEVDPKILFVTFPGSYSRYMTVANPWATICLPYAVTSAQRAETNATFYSISHKDATKLYLKEETGDLVAGRPYIFHFDGEADATLTISCGTTASAASNYNGLIGTYKKVRVAENYYMIIGGEVRRVSAESEAYCDATKAYFNANLEGVPTEPSPAPGQRIIEMPLIENNATNINNIDATEEVVKFIQNGKLFIQKNGLVYDMLGNIVI